VTSDLFRLVYCSRPVVRGDSPDFGRQIENILASARRNNAHVGVTGALIFNSGVFVQVLEGPHVVIADLFDRIRRDERHYDVTMLSLEPIAVRRFPNWSMGYLGASRRGQTLFADVAKATDFDAKRLEGERIFDLIQLIAVEEELPGE